MNKLVKALDRHVEVRQSTADLGFGIGVLLVDLFLMLVGVAKYISEGYTTSYGITAKTFPKVVFIAGIILSAILIVTALTKRAKHDPNEGKVTFHLINFAIFADLVLFVFTIIPLGYPIANIIMMVIMYWLSGGKSWVKAIVMSVVFTIVSVAFFYYYLKLAIPMGLLSSILV